jgi:hypothetical protein
MCSSAIKAPLHIQRRCVVRRPREMPYHRWSHDPSPSSVWKKEQQKKRGKIHRLRDYPTSMRRNSDQEVVEQSMACLPLSRRLLISSNKTRVEASKLLDHSSTGKFTEFSKHKNTCVLQRIGDASGRALSRVLEQALQAPQ